MFVYKLYNKFHFELPLKYFLLPLFISAMNDGVFKQKSRGERAETNKRQTACEIIRTVNYLVNHMINGTWTLLVTSRRASTLALAHYTPFRKG